MQNEDSAGGRILSLRILQARRMLSPEPENPAGALWEEKKSEPEASHIGGSSDKARIEQNPSPLPEYFATREVLLPVTFEITSIHFLSNYF